MGGRLKLIAALRRAAPPPINIPDQAALDAALLTYANSSVDVTLLLAADGVFTAGTTYTRTGSGTLKIKGASATNRAKVGNIILSNTQNLWFENLDFGNSTWTQDIALIAAGNPGSGAPGSINTTLVNCDAYGQAYDPYGDYTNPAPRPTNTHGLSGTYTNLSIIDCWWYALSYAIRPNQMYGNFLSLRNCGDLIFEDSTIIGVSDRVGSVVVKDPTWTRFVGKGTDTANPHTDANQSAYVPGQSNETCYRVSTQGMVVIAGASRTTPQGSFAVANGTNNRFVEINNQDCIFYMGDPTGVTPLLADDKAPAIGDASVAGNISRNRGILAIPGVSVGAANVAACELTTIHGEVPGLVGDNFSENVRGTYSTHLGNYALNQSSTNATAAAQMADIFVGPFPITGLLYGSRENVLASRALAAAACEYKPTGPLGDLNGVYNFATGVVDWSKTRPFVGLQQYRDVLRSAVIETPWMPVWNVGPSGVAITVLAGTEYRIASTRLGGGAASYTTAPGTVFEGQYVMLRVTTPSGYAAQQAYGCTLRDQVYTAYVTTVSSAQYSWVDNGGTAYSVLTTPPSEPNRTKLILAVGTQYNVAAPGKAIIGQSGAGNGLHLTGSSGTPNFQARSSGSLSKNMAGKYDTYQHVDVFTADFGAALPADVFQWWRDGELQPLAMGGSAANALVFDPSSHLASLVAFALTNVGGGLCSGKMAFMWVDWGAAGYTFPALTNNGAWTKWLPDNVNMTDGSGPTGTKPKIWLPFTAAGLNAGLVSLGSVTGLTLTKAAGTYT